MAKQLYSIDPMDELRLNDEPETDRLPAMLFLAALIHGVLIMGVGFNPVIPDAFADAISLEVTIVADPDQSIDHPDNAEYLAQASQKGGGNTREQARASAPLKSESPIDNLGDADAADFTDAYVNSKRADELLSTQSSQDRKIREDKRHDPEDQRRVAAMLEAGADSTLPLPQEQDATLKIHHDDSRELIISADTRESSVAGYLDSWKRRIERVGIDYLPEAAKHLSGSPTLEVSIDASGQLAGVIIRKSSGSQVLDRAALDILRRASPFDPFPEDVRAEYDTLRFAYKWMFGDSSVATTVAANR